MCIEYLISLHAYTVLVKNKPMCKLLDTGGSGGSGGTFSIIGIMKERILWQDFNVRVYK